LVLGYGRARSAHHSVASLHGSAEAWGLQQPALVAAGHRVIAYSRRGFHKSQTGPKESPGTFADDLNALLDYLDIKAFHGVGSAQGAFVPLDYSLSYPGK
jgi:pimeloyl-ACP methyl ester carboxylesterase